VGKPEGKRPLGRSGRTRENIIKIYLPKVEWRHGLMDLTQDRERYRAFVNSVMKLRVP